MKGTPLAGCTRIPDAGTGRSDKAILGPAVHTWPPVSDLTRPAAARYPHPCSATVSSCGPLRGRAAKHAPPLEPARFIKLLRAWLLMNASRKAAGHPLFCHPHRHLRLRPCDGCPQLLSTPTSKSPPDLLFLLEEASTPPDVLRHSCAMSLLAAGDRTNHLQPAALCSAISRRPLPPTPTSHADMTSRRKPLPSPTVTAKRAAPT